MTSSYSTTEFEELQRIARSPGGRASVEEGRFKSWLRHSSEASINRVASDLTDLELCAAHLCDLRERYVHCKAPLSERELLALDEVIGRWATLWKRLYGDASGQTHLWNSPHFEKVIRRCMQRGHSAFLWLAEFALMGHGSGPDASHQELLLTQSLVEGISAYLSLYEAWCLHKHKHAPTDIGSDLARIIAMQPLACNVRVMEGCYEPSRLLRGWLLLAVYRRYLSESIGESGAMRLVDEVIQGSSNSGQIWGGRDPNDSILLLNAADGCVYFGVEDELCGASLGDKVLRWLLPWCAVYSLLHSSGNKGQALPLLNATHNLKAGGCSHVVCRTQAKH